MPRARQRSRNRASTSGGYSTPQGLLGETRTIARVPSGRRRAASSGSGIRSRPVGSGTALIAAMSSAILWLKYHGTGSATASPGPASVATTAQNASLQPAVIATCAAATSPP